MDLWIDRDHSAWITAMFTQGTEARQAELEREFPGVGAVAVEVEVDNSRPDLRRTARRLREFLEDRITAFGIDSGNDKNIVTLRLNVVTDQLVAALKAEFAGQPICLEGSDPEDLVQPSPQPTSGDGWVLLGWKQGRGPARGPAHRTGIATDQASYERLWAETGLPGSTPAVDFSEDVVVWFAIGHGSSCADLRMDEVIVDQERRQVYPLIVMPDNPTFCTADLVGSYQFVVALEWSELPAGPFELGLDPRGRGELFASISVGVDLRAPGSTASPSEVADPAPSVPRSGTIVETIGSSRYAFDTTCGLGYLGVINGTHWVSTVSDVPEAWRPAVEEDGDLVVTIRLRTKPELHVRATRNGHTVRYLPATEAPAACGD